MASCMIRKLQTEDEVAYFDDIVRYVKWGLPKDIDNYYGRMLARYNSIMLSANDIDDGDWVLL